MNLDKKIKELEIKIQSNTDSIERIFSELDQFIKKSTGSQNKPTSRAKKTIKETTFKQILSYLKKSSTELFFYSGGIFFRMHKKHSNYCQNYHFNFPVQSEKMYSIPVSELDRFNPDSTSILENDLDSLGCVVSDIQRDKILIDVKEYNYQKSMAHPIGLEWKNYNFLRTAVSKEMIREAYTGILFDSGFMVATDSRRMHIINDVYNKKEKYILTPPIKLKTGTDLTLRISEKLCMWSQPLGSLDLDIITFNIEGNYPNWRQVLNGLDHRVTDVIQADKISMDRMIKLTKENDFIGKIQKMGQDLKLIECTPELKPFELFLNSLPLSVSEIEMFPSAPIGINVKFLSEALSFADQWSIWNKDSTATLYPLKFIAGNKTALLMPIMLD